MSEIKGNTNVVRSVCVTPDNKYVVSGSEDRTVRITNIQAGELFHVIKGHTDWVNRVCATDEYVVSGSRDRTVSVMPLTEES